MSKHTFFVNATYPANLYPQYDEKLSKLVKKNDYGSGMGFGERDITFYFSNTRKALAAFDKLNRCKKLCRISLTIEK